MLRIFGLVIMSEDEYEDRNASVFTRGFMSHKEFFDNKYANRDPKTGRFVKRGE